MSFQKLPKPTDEQVLILQGEIAAHGEDGNVSTKTDLQQTCKACGRPDYFDFHVSDETWARVVGPDLTDHVVCLGCFDRLAARAGIDYRGELTQLYFAGKQFGIVFAAAIIGERAVKE